MFIFKYFRSYVILVSLSALPTFISAVFVIGIPTEVYYYGAMFSMAWMGYIIFSILGAHIFIPFHHDMGFLSAYQVVYLGIQDLIFEYKNNYSHIQNFQIGLREVNSS